MRHRLTLKLTGMKGKHADCLEENELGEGGFGNRLILRIYLFFSAFVYSYFSRWLLGGRFAFV
jgi:hypothetical protein